MTRCQTSVRLMKPSAWIQIWDNRHWATAPTRKVRHKPEMSTHIASCTCIYTGVHMKSELQRTGTRSAAECPPCCLCHRSAVFFRHVYVTALSFPYGKVNGTPFEYAVSALFTFFLNCVNFKLQIGAVPLLVKSCVWNIFSHPNKVITAKTQFLDGYWHDSKLDCNTPFGGGGGRHRSASAGVNCISKMNQIWWMKDQLDITCYFISLIMCSTCFGH